MAHSHPFIATALALALCAGPARPADGRVSEAEARNLVLAAIGPKVVDAMPGFTLERNDHARVLGFFEFDATFKNPRGSPIAGFYAVNEVTADVWQLVICRKLTSAELRELQVRLYRQHNITRRERLRAARAPCER